MKTFRIVFAKNEILTCKEAENNSNLNGSSYYEHENGNLIFAIVKAPGEEEAINMAKRIVQEVKERVYGSEFIF